MSKARCGGWAILVVWSGGAEEYVRLGADASGPVYHYASRAEAQFQAAFMRITLDYVQSINVVKYPRSPSRPNADARSSNPVVVSAPAEPRADLAVERRGRVCCCGHGFFTHDPATCTGKRCGCRGFHEPEARKELHVALDGGGR